ncbi:MAG: carboxypeptidase-like regulatory domain-containing protein [Bryobacteraceae bacterium]
MTIRTPLLLLVAATAGMLVWAQQSDPKPTPGGRKEPGLFGGDRGDKKNKGEDENTRAVAGYVRDAREDPVEGAVVQLKDLKTLKVRSYITKPDGIYRFFGLSTSADYELRAGYKNFASPVRTLSIYDSRRQATMNLKLEPKGPESKSQESKNNEAEKTAQK